MLSDTAIFILIVLKYLLYSFSCPSFVHNVYKGGINMEQILSMDFTAYVGLAVVLYAIRQATGINNRFIPITAVILGIAFSIFENGAFNFDTMMMGIQYALYGVGTVATIKYTLTKAENLEPKSK